MKYNLIKTDNYLLVVHEDITQAKEGCFIYRSDVGVVYCDNKFFFDFGKPYKKIISHLPLNGAPYLDGVDVLPPTWGDGGEKLHEESSPYPRPYDTYEKGYVHGYDKSREKYKFTEEDILDAWELGAKEGLPLTRKKKEDLFDSLRQSKLPVAFECEVEPKFKHIGSTKEVKGSGSRIKNKHAGNPKTIINSEGRVEWVGKYIYE